MIRHALILAALLATTPAAQAGCMGANRSLCAFARAHNLTIISGFRRHATIRGTRRPSRHRYGKAIDVKGHGRGWRSRIRRAANRRGFRVGLYCGRLRHMHIEIPRRRGNLRTFYKGCRVRRASR